MKRILLLSLVGAAFVGCGEVTPVAPDAQAGPLTAALNGPVVINSHGGTAVGVTFDQNGFLDWLVILNKGGQQGPGLGEANVSSILVLNNGSQPCFDNQILSTNDFFMNINEAQISVSTFCGPVDLQWSRIGKVSRIPTSNVWLDELFGQEIDSGNCSMEAVHEVYNAVGNNADLTGTINGVAIQWDVSYIEHSHFHRQICGVEDGH